MHQEPKLPLSFSSKELLRELIESINNAVKLQAEITKARNTKNSKTYFGSEYPMPSGKITINSVYTFENNKAQVLSNYSKWEKPAVDSILSATEVAHGLLGKKLRIVGTICSDDQQWVGSIQGVLGGRYEKITRHINVTTERILDSVELYFQPPTIIVRFNFDWQKRPYYFEVPCTQRVNFSFID